MQSDRSDSRGLNTQRTQSLTGSGDTRGKHRIQAELKRLEQETRFLEEELEQLDKTEKASAACNETLRNVEAIPDPLLPITNGPLNPLWDRWFERPKESRGCRCWILWWLQFASDFFHHYSYTDTSNYMLQFYMSLFILPSNFLEAPSLLVAQYNASFCRKWHFDEARFLKVMIFSSISYWGMYKFEQ